MAVGNGVANFNGSAGNYPFIQQSGVRRGGFGDKYEITFTVTDWNNGTIGGSYTTLRLNMDTYPNDGVPSDVDNTSQDSFAQTKYPLLMDSNTVQLNTPIKKTFISDGGNGLRIYVEPYDADISITNISLRKIEDRQSVRFNDSILDTKGWKNPRYDGSKLIGAEINKYTKGDITYGKNPVINKKSTSIYFGTSVIGADGIEDSSLVKIKNHSYVNIDTIISIDPETDNVEIINTSATPYDSYQRLLANDLSQDKNFSLKILDKNVENKKKNNYKSKFSQGLLYKTVEHKGKDGTGNIMSQGIQAGSVYSSSFQNGYSTTRRTPNLIKNPHFLTFGSELIKDGNFTGPLVEPNRTENWYWVSLSANLDGDGIFAQSIPGVSAQYAGLTQPNIKLEDGELYRLEYVASSVLNGGGSHTSPIILGDGNNGGVGSYRPIGSSTNVLYNGKQIWDFKFDKSSNSNSDFMSFYMQMTNSNPSTFDKTMRLKNVSLRKITQNTSGYTISPGSGTAWTIANGRATAGDGSDWGYLNIATSTNMILGRTYELELDIVRTAGNASDIKLANNLNGGGDNLEFTTLDGNQNGHQKIRWVHDSNGGNLHQIRLYNSSTWQGYVTNLRLYEVEPYETDGNVFCWGKSSNTMNSSTLEIFKNDLTREIWPQEETFGLVDSITSSQNYVYDSMQNVSTFYDSRLFPFASESQKRLFVTFSDGQPITQRKGIIIPSNVGIKTISTAELDLGKYSFHNMDEVTSHKAGGLNTTTLNYTTSIFMDSSSNHYLISGSYHSQNNVIYDTEFYGGTDRPLTLPNRNLIPIKKGAHDITIDYRKRRGGSTGDVLSSGTYPNTIGAAHTYINYVYSGNENAKATYQLSYLEERPTIIANIDKTKELMNGTGEKGFILIPENLDINIKTNLDYYLSKLDLIEEKGIKKLPKRKEN